MICARTVGRCHTVSQCRSVWRIVGLGPAGVAAVEAGSGRGAPESRVYGLGVTVRQEGVGFCGPGTCPPDGRIPLILTPCSSRCGTRSRSFPRRQRGSVVQCFFWGSSSGAMRLALRTCSGRQLRPATAWVSCSPETGMLIFPRKRGTFPEASRQGSFGRHFAALPTVSRLSICSQNRF
jgi:hypothetical protein